MRNLIWLGLVLGCIASGAAAAPGDEQNSVQAPSTDTGHTGGLFADSSFEAASGVDYSSGHYGAPIDTTVWSIPLDLKAQIGRLRLQATLPYEFIKGPGQLVGGVVVLTPGTTTTATSRSGFGDLNLSATYLLTRENGILPAIEVGGGIKTPTAKTGIGTGEADYAATASLYKTLAPRVILFGSVGYSWLGSPSAYRLKNGVVASGGLNYRPASNQNYGVSLSYREPVADGLKGQTIVSPYMTYRVSKLWGVTLYGMGGLNDASPRIGGGLRLSIFG
ncbi:transporter [Sphingobium sp. EM0848]|uniref:transporter n=1 Tax=Sphingobium sp. EM0848 TaxID=2743473 RepID=UPI00159CADEF|nr:transporter [Sphingobium sp. EM0848]